MNTRYATQAGLILLAVVITLGMPLPTLAESTADLLEQAIYTEQTVGDLQAAIEIYKRVVENGEANRPNVAQAQLRLGMCYIKTGSDEAARTVLEKLIREYPEQDQILAQAREQLAALRNDLPLRAAPWADGELLEYQIGLPTGKVLGRIYLSAELASVEGVDAWRLEQRKVIFTSADNQGTSRVLVERDTQRPISSLFRHGILGNADAIYGPEGVEISSGGSDSLVDSHPQVYDNEQFMHLLRALPLKTGYTTKINLLPTWTGAVLEVGLEVSEKESCEVPAGKFECHAVKLDIGQTLWYSTGPEQYPVRLSAGGAIIELAKIGEFRSLVPFSYGLQDFGFSGTLPAGWLTYVSRSAERVDSAMIRFLDNDSEAISAVEVDRCPPGRCPPLEPTAERELSGAKERFEGYKLREGSWHERTIDGRPAISFVGDYMRNGKAWVQYRIYTITEELRLEFIFRAPAERFEDLRASFDSVVDSLETK